MKLETKVFGLEDVFCYSFINEKGEVFSATNLGARIVSWKVLDKNQRLIETVLGMDSATEYLEKDPYIGATIGRVAGRIANGHYTYDNQTVQLTQNEQGNTLHGGPHSFEEAVWEAEATVENGMGKIVFHLFSPAGENGFPGDLNVKVTYTISEDMTWQIDYEAKTNETTLFNPTNHVYFNLNGHYEQTIDNHLLYVNADRYVPLLANNLPIGKKQSVVGTAFDVRDEAGTRLEDVFSLTDEQVLAVGGYDHPFVLNQPSLKIPQASIKSLETGLTLSVYTDAASIVIFTLNLGDKTIMMREQEVKHHSGITFETQALPDAINQEDFGNIVLKPNDVFRSTTIYRWHEKNPH